MPGTSLRIRAASAPRCVDARQPALPQIGVGRFDLVDAGETRKASGQCIGEQTWHPPDGRPASVEKPRIRKRAGRRARLEKRAVQYPDLVDSALTPRAHVVAEIPAVQILDHSGARSVTAQRERRTRHAEPQVGFGADRDQLCLRTQRVREFAGNDSAVVAAGFEAQTAADENARTLAHRRWRRSEFSRSGCAKR